MLMILIIILLTSNLCVVVTCVIVRAALVRCHHNQLAMSNDSDVLTTVQWLIFTDGGITGLIWPTPNLLPVLYN